MSERHTGPTADVRAFLPRRGEPVEEYVERLRALHRDLTLVLQAVERGLAASTEPEATRPPAAPPAHNGPPTADDESLLADAHLHAAEPHHASVSRLLQQARGGPRVEVVPSSAGPQRRDVGEARRRPRAPGDDDPAARDPDSARSAFPARPSGRRGQAAETPPARVERPVPGPAGLRPDEPERRAAPAVPHPRVVERPRPAAEREHPWVEASPVGAPSPQEPAGRDPGPGPVARRAAPLLVAATMTGWLIVLALVLGLLLR